MDVAINHSIKCSGFSSTKYTDSLFNVSWMEKRTGVCPVKCVKLSMECSLSGDSIASKSYIINCTFFSIGFSHFQINTRLYFVSYPLFAMSQSILHVSIYLIFCLLVRFSVHICPC